MAVHFRDYYPDLHLENYDLRKKMEVFLGQLREYEADSQALADTEAKVNGFLSDESLWEKQVNAQDRYINQVGDNGLDDTVQLIQDKVEGTNL